MTNQCVGFALIAVAFLIWCALLVGGRGWHFPLVWRGLRKHEVTVGALTRVEAVALRAALETFEDDWDAPGMDAYDAL